MSDLYNLTMRFYIFDPYMLLIKRLTWPGIIWSNLMFNVIKFGGYLISLFILSMIYNSVNSGFSPNKVNDSICSSYSSKL